MEIYLGLLFGSIGGIILVYVAYRQQFSKWMTQGFARAKTQEEKQKVASYYNSPSYKKSMWSRYYFPALLIAGILTLYIGNFRVHIFGFDLLPLLGFGAFSFVVCLLGGLSIVSITSDKKIRASKKSSQG